MDNAQKIFRMKVFAVDEVRILAACAARRATTGAWTHRSGGRSGAWGGSTGTGCCAANRARRALGFCCAARQPHPTAGDSARAQARPACTLCASELTPPALSWNRCVPRASSGTSSVSSSVSSARMVRSWRATRYALHKPSRSAAATGSWLGCQGRTKHAADASCGQPWLEAAGPCIRRRCDGAAGAPSLV